MLKSAKHKALLLIVSLPLFINACSLTSPKITKAKYDRIQTGMTLSQVQDIMGLPGENSAEMSLSLPGISASPDASNPSLEVKPSLNQSLEFKPAVYQWKNQDGSLMTAIFVNDKLISKTQVNLK